MDKDIFYTARYDGEPDISGDINDELSVIAYDTIIRRFEDMSCALTDSGVFFKDISLTVSCTVQRLQNADETGGSSAALLFFLDHELFDEPVCEYSAGLGSTAEEAIINGTEQFCAVVLMSVLSTFGCEDPDTVNAEFGGKERSFTHSCTAYTYSIGGEPHSPELFSLIKDALPDYLGSKNAYWLKLFVACYDDEPVCEVRLNGAVMSELSDLLYNYALTWEDKQTFHSEKQFVMLLSNKREETAVPAANVIELTEKAIELMGASTNEDADREADNSILEMCRSFGTVGYEILCFVPEIYCCALLQLHRSDILKVYIGDAEVKLKCSQLRNFGYIEQAVIRYLTQQEPEQSVSENILWRSSLFESVNNAVADGIMLEDINISDVRFHAPPDYRLI